MKGVEIMEEFLRNLQDDISKVDKVKDIVKLNEDISEGERLRLVGFEMQKEEYIKRIKSDYCVYVKIIDSVCDKREEKYGKNSSRVLNNIDDILNHYIKMLKLIRDGKLYEALSEVFREK